MHNDIKLENLVVGHNDPDRLYLIDFGLASHYLKPDGTHIEKERLGKFSGNFMYASLNSCRGNNKSRRDDIESAMYLLTYILNGCKLPWSNLDVRLNYGSTFNDLLVERLVKSYTMAVLKMVPAALV